MKLLSIILLAIFFSCSCPDRSIHPVKDEQDFIVAEKDLIPEGTAFDPVSDRIFISSTYKRKIIQIKENGTVDDFILEAQDDIKSVLGMEVDTSGNCLWAVSSEAKYVLPLIKPGIQQWRSSIFRYNLADGTLIKKYPLTRESVFLNDLTIGPDGVVYVTESINNAIYKIPPNGDSLELFLMLKPYTFINGICFTDKPGFLFASSNEGIIAIDMTTKKYTCLPAPSAEEVTGIDGLSFAKNYFIGHQSSKVCRFYLSPKRDSIIKVDTLATGKEFDSSTTGVVSGGFYYFVVNTQVKSGVDFTLKRIKPRDSLENIIIRKIKL